MVNTTNQKFCATNQNTVTNYKNHTKCQERRKSKNDVAILKNQVYR